MLRHRVDPPEAVRPLMAFGGIAMMFLTLIQLLGNQFGFDRGGFRVFVPLLIASFLGVMGWLPMASEGTSWIASWPAVIAFATATVLETAGYFIPWFDHLLDTVASPAAVIAGNTIHDIHVRELFTGAEMAGIKFHAAIDTVIKGNHIYRTCLGLWLDWMAQGTRVSGNLFHDNAGVAFLLVGGQKLIGQGHRLIRSLNAAVQYQCGDELVADGFQGGFYYQLHPLETGCQHAGCSGGERLLNDGLEPAAVGYGGRLYYGA